MLKRLTTCGMLFICDVQNKQPRPVVDSSVTGTIPSLIELLPLQLLAVLGLAIHLTSVMDTMAGSEFRG